MGKKIGIIVAVALVLITVLTVLVINVPGGSQREDSGREETTTQESEKENKSNIPEDLNFGGEEITFLIWSDWTMNEFYAEQETGDMITDAIYKRNMDVETRLGVKLKYAEEKGNHENRMLYIKKAESDYRSGHPEYDIYASYSRTVSTLSLSGMLKDISDAKYLNFRNSWWPRAMVDECTVNNKMFFCSGDISTNLLWMMTAMFFNKELLQANNLEDPYKLVKSGDWTLDKLIEMTSNLFSDNDGQGEKDANDMFGQALYSTNIDGYLTSSGFISLEENGDGDIVVSDRMKSQKTIDFIDKMGKYINSPGVFCGKIDKRKVFFDEHAVFTTDRVFIVAGKDNGPEDKIEFLYGIIPVPKYDKAQERYITNLGYPHTLYAISNAVSDERMSDICDATLECMAEESYRLVTPMVFETAMKYRYATDDEASQMYDILRENVSFDLERLYSYWTGNVYGIARKEIQNNGKTFASQIKGIEKIMQKGIAEISKAYGKTDITG